MSATGILAWIRAFFGPTPLPAPTPGPSPLPPPIPTPITAEDFVAEMNAHRLPGTYPLVEIPSISSFAQSWARWMADHRTMVHDPRPEVYSVYAENIAYGQTSTAQVVAGWMDELPGLPVSHRANIENPAYTRVGVGWAASANGSLYFSAKFQ